MVVWTVYKIPIYQRVNVLVSLSTGTVKQTLMLVYIIPRGWVKGGEDHITVILCETDAPAPLVNRIVYTPACL